MSVENIKEKVLLDEPIYVTDFTCTYNLMDNENDNFLCYQLQLLQAYDIKSFDEDIINKTTEYLYEKYKNNEDISRLLIISKKNNKAFFIEDELMAFRIFFQYDTFYLFHSILCNLISNTSINTTILDKLIKVIDLD
jgi:hypothetical protein